MARGLFPGGASVAHLVLAGCLGMFCLAAFPSRSAGIPPSTPADPGAAGSREESSFRGSGVVAYYFHVNVRCQSCLLIEQRSGEVIKGAFDKELREGVLAWNVLNTERPENRRFIAELGLPTRGLVLVAYQDGNPGRSRILEGVWQHIHGEPAGFQHYLSNEVRDFLDAKP